MRCKYVIMILYVNGTILYAMQELTLLFSRHSSAFNGVNQHRIMKTHFLLSVNCINKKILHRKLSLYEK